MAACLGGRHGNVWPPMPTVTLSNHCNHHHLLALPLRARERRLMERLAAEARRGRKQVAGVGDEGAGRSSRGMLHNVVRATTRSSLIGSAAAPSEADLLTPTAATNHLPASRCATVPFERARRRVELRNRSAAL